MSKIKNGGLDQYGAELFEQQQFGTAGVEGVKQSINQYSFIKAFHNNSFIITISTKSSHATWDYQAHKLLDHIAI